MLGHINHQKFLRVYYKNVVIEIIPDFLSTAAFANHRFFFSFFFLCGFPVEAAVKQRIGKGVKVLYFIGSDQKCGINFLPAVLIGLKKTILPRKSSLVVFPIEFDN